MWVLSPEGDEDGGVTAAGVAERSDVAGGGLAMLVPGEVCNQQKRQTAQLL